MYVQHTCKYMSHCDCIHKNTSTETQWQYSALFRVHVHDKERVRRLIKRYLTHCDGHTAHYCIIITCIYCYCYMMHVPVPVVSDILYSVFFMASIDTAQTNNICIVMATG